MTLSLFIACFVPPWSKVHIHYKFLLKFNVCFPSSQVYQWNLQFCCLYPKCHSIHSSDIIVLEILCLLFNISVRVLNKAIHKVVSTSATLIHIRDGCSVNNCANSQHYSSTAQDNEKRRCTAVYFFLWKFTSVTM